MFRFVNANAKCQIWIELLKLLLKVLFYGPRPVIYKTNRWHFRVLNAISSKLGVIKFVICNNCNILQIKTHKKWENPPKNLLLEKRIFIGKVKIGNYGSVSHHHIICFGNYRYRYRQYFYFLNNKIYYLQIIQGESK